MSDGVLRRPSWPSFAQPRAHRFGRYTLVCVFNVVAGAMVLSATFGGLGWSARSANLAGTVAVTLPSYFLNRAWVWGRSGRSHLVREVMPFWAMAFVGLGLSTWTAAYAERLAAHLTTARAAQTVMVVAAMVATFGALWLARFALLESVVFADRTTARRPKAEPAEAAPAALPAEPALHPTTG